MKKYSVLLLYPDYANDMAETYFSWVEATAPAAAVALARAEAVEANHMDADDVDNFKVLLVVEGHHLELSGEV